MCINKITDVIYNVRGKNRIIIHEHKRCRKRTNL